MPRTRVNVDALIQDIHLCALAPERWPSVLSRIVAVLDGQKANLLTYDCDLLQILHGDHVDWVKPYHEHFMGEDLWLRGAIETDAFRPGVVALDDALVERRHMLRSTFFNEFLVKHGIDRAVCMCLNDGRGEPGMPMTALSVFRPPGRPGFADRHVTFLRKLAPHLKIAVDNHVRWKRAQQHHAAARSVIDRLSAALFVLSARGHLLFANAAGESELRSRRWLDASRGELRAAGSVTAHEDATKRVSRLVLSRRAFALELRSGAERAVLAGAPVPHGTSAEDAMDKARAVLWLVVAPACADGVTLLAGMYGLTGAERRLLERLAAGDDVAAAADALLVSANTVRVQLKSVFAKTGCRRQADLRVLIERLSLVRLPSTHG